MCILFKGTIHPTLGFQLHLCQRMLLITPTFYNCNNLTLMCFYAVQRKESLQL